MTIFNEYFNLKKFLQTNKKKQKKQVSKSTQYVLVRQYVKELASRLRTQFKISSNFVERNLFNVSYLEININIRQKLTKTTQFFANRWKLHFTCTFGKMGGKTRKNECPTFENVNKAYDTRYLHKKKKFSKEMK